MMRNNDLSVIINEGTSSGGKGQGARGKGQGARLKIWYIFYFIHKLLVFPIIDVGARNRA